jgi:hypothetical protein
MRAFFASILLVGALFSPAQAAPTNEITLASMGGVFSQSLTGTKVKKPAKYRHHLESSPVHAKGVGPRPSKWCGWWMRTKFGGGAEYNLARNWAKRGSPSQPHVGAVVVWPHHVGYISGRSADGRWIVTSGNDGGAVRSRARSISGAIAIRSLSGSYQVAGL